MDLERLEGILREADPQLTVRGPSVELTVDGTKVVVLTDPSHDRMRMIVPITETAESSGE